MNPTNIHFIKYKSNFLGTSSNLIGFVKHSLAKTVYNNIKYEKFNIIHRNNEFNINYNKSGAVIKKKDLLITSQDFDTSLYYAALVNMPLCIIDEVIIDKNYNIKMISNYNINVDIEINNDSRIEVLDTIFNDITIADI